MLVRFFAHSVAFAIVALSVVVPAHAFDAKTVTIKVGFGAGGGYDVSSRVVANHLGRFLPGNPNVIVQNVPGGGGLKLMKLMMSSEPADGSVIASISSSFAFTPKLEPELADYDPLTIKWVGAMAHEPSYCIVNKAKGVDSLESFLSADLLVGASGKSSLSYLLAALVKNGIGAKYKIVTGFDGQNEIVLAMERGEIDAVCAISNSTLENSDMLDRVNVIGRFGTKTIDRFKDAPRFSEQISDPVIRQGAELIESARDFHYPLIAPPGTPDETVAILRDAYAKMLADPQFIEEAKTVAEIDVDPTLGNAMQDGIAQKLTLPDEIFAAARALAQ